MSETGEEVKTESTELKGIALSGALADQEVRSNECGIVLTLKDNRAPEVTMTGFWDGNLLKAAMRSIERKYDEVRKYATINAMKQSQLNKGEAK